MVNKIVKKTIKAGIKKEISVRGIDTTTRKGNKELKFLIDKIACYPFDNQDEARVAEDKLGQHLGELLQQKKKNNLDGGIIRQVANQRDLLSLAGLSMSESKAEQISVEDYSGKVPLTQTSANKEQMTKATEISEKETVVLEVKTESQSESETETELSQDSTEIIDISEVKTESQSELETETEPSQNDAKVIVVSKEVNASDLDQNSPGQ